MTKLCEFCGSYSPRDCELREEMDGVCPWEESELDPDRLREDRDERRRVDKENPIAARDLTQPK